MTIIERSAEKVVKRRQNVEIQLTANDAKAFRFGDRFARLIDIMPIKIKRAYDDAVKNDGYRVLVDRIWPRGVSKEDAKIDLWIKEIAPTTELRKSFDHDPDKWTEFEKKFKAEIHDNKDVWKQLRDVVKEHSTVTLVYAAKDEEHNNAVVLERMLKK